MSLTYAQASVLRTLRDRTFESLPFPAMSTMHALRRPDLIDVVDDQNGESMIIATPAGIEAIDDADAEVARNCANWRDGECQSCGVPWQYFMVGENFECPHFDRRKQGL